MAESDREGAGDRRDNVDLAALKGRAEEAKALLRTLRPNGKPPPRRTLGGKETCEFSVRLKVVTPILGGGPKLRDVDRVDIIRVPTVRGHLRFWWRALYGHLFDAPQQLYEAESALWGRAAEGEDGGRSGVEVRVSNIGLNGLPVEAADTRARLGKDYDEEWAWFKERYQRLHELDRESGRLPRNPEGRARRDAIRAQIEAERAILRTRYEQGQYFDFRDPRWLRVMGSYALWVSGSTDEHLFPQVRWKPCTLSFKLEVCGPPTMHIAGKEYDGNVVLQNTVRAWVLFGGYGSRTRRGLGTLTVSDAQDAWLPSSNRNSAKGALLPLAAAIRASLRDLFGLDIFTPRASQEAASISGANLWVAAPINGAEDNAERAWDVALDWLKEFRQGTASGARAGGGGGFGRSNWPEADKIRHLTNVWCHPQHDPTGRHSQVPAWPRAGFGLPIVGKFKDRCDPGPFELRWRSVHGNHDRLASPLIVKAMPLADGRFVPMALWLARANPDQSEVYLKDVDGAHQSFHVLEAPADPTTGVNKDVALFQLLRSQTSLQTVFFSYLKSRGASKVAP